MKRYLNLFWIFFKISMVTIGGGNAMLPFIEREIVDRHRYLEKDEMLDVIAIAQMLPGIMIINCATYVGRKIGGFWGAVSTFFGSTLPSLIVILLIAILMPSFADNPYVQKAFTGIRIGISGIILVYTYERIKRIAKDIFSWLVAATSLPLIFFTDISVIWLFLVAASVSLIVNRKAKVAAND